MTSDQIVSEALKIAQRVIDELETRHPPFDHQLYSTALDELIRRGNAMPEETRELLIAFMGTFLARQRLSDESIAIGDPILPEDFGMVYKGTAH